MYKKICALPFGVWILCGTVVPLFAVAYYGLTDDGGMFTTSNILSVISEDHFKALSWSFLLAFISTLVCLVLAFPLALILKHSKFGKRGFIIFIFILPMWMNFLLRTMAWQVMLERGGFLNTLFDKLGLPAFEIINTPAAIVLGMVYDFFPFMVLPLYNVMIKIDDNIIEAAYDLGATRSKVIKSIILPLSLPGIASGITMVFVPSLTTFAISNILGGGKIYLIGNVIEQEFTATENWHLGSGLSLVMMLFIVVSMMFISGNDKKGEGGLI